MSPSSPKPFMVLLYSQICDPNGTHKQSLAALSKCITKSGIAVRKYCIESLRDIEDLTAACLNENCIGVYCEQGWGLNLRDLQNQKIWNVHSQIPVFAVIRDMPFYYYVRDNIENLTNNVSVFFTDQTAAAYVAQTGIKTEAQLFFLPHVDFMPHCDLSGAETAKAEKIGPILYAGSYRDPNTGYERWSAMSHGQRSTLSVLVDAAYDDYDKPTWQHAIDLFNCDKADFPPPNSSRFHELCTCANEVIRNGRRLDLIEILAPKVPVTFVWNGLWPDVRLHKDSTIISRAKLVDVSRLMNQAKACVMSLNNFTHSLSERLLGTFKSKTVPICANNALMRQHFKMHDTVLDPGRRNTDLITQIEKSLDNDWREEWENRTSTIGIRYHPIVLWEAIRSKTRLKTEFWNE